VTHRIPLHGQAASTMIFAAITLTQPPGFVVDLDFQATKAPLGMWRHPMTPLAVIVIVIAVVLLSGLRIAQEYQRGVVFRLGRYLALRGPGLYWIVPLVSLSTSLAECLRAGLNMSFSSCRTPPVTVTTSA